MKAVLFLLLGVLVGAKAFSGPKCTDVDKSKWQDQKGFKVKLKEQGYRIKVFKVTSGNCYEIYGWDKDSKKVEIYFHPVTAKIVKKKTY